MKSFAAMIGALVLATATPALAHTGASDHGGFVQGFLHPLGGLDHLLAMVAVGVLAFQVGGRALWLVPASFVLMMVAGGLLGFSGGNLPNVELGIAASVLVLGALLTVKFQLPTLSIAGIAGLFAVFHGYAHGVELPGDASPQSFAIGFVMSTSLLHATGLALGRALAALPGIATRVSGIVMMASGITMV